MPASGRWRGKWWGWDVTPGGDVYTPVTRTLWNAANCPCQTGDDLGRCRVCGIEGNGAIFEQWVRPTFTDFDKLQSGSIICSACQFCFAEQSKLLAAEVGKEKPQRMRNYSHFVVDKEWLPLSKARKRDMIYILLYRKPEVAIIAQSGQKHIIFRAVPGIVQFEEQQIPDLRGMGPLFAAIETLYSVFSKSEIESGDYSHHHILNFGLSFWHELESTVAPVRQTALFALALFLAQREGGKRGRVALASGGVAGRDLARYPEQLQIPLPAFDLAAV